MHPSQRPLLTGLAAGLALALAAGSAQAQQPRAGRSSASSQRQDDPGLPPAAQKVFPTKVTWVLKSINGRPFGAAGEAPSLSVDEQLRARGFSGCNSFSATSYPLKQQKFVVGPYALTRNSCPKPVMDAERAFLVAFARATNWDIAPGALILKGEGGELRFERGL